MKIKSIILSLAATLALSNAGAACMNDFKDQTHYLLNKVPATSSITQNIQNPHKKPVLIEFFWYGCPHCYHMQPYIKSVVDKQKDNIIYVRFPVPFNRWESGARLFFALDALGLENKLHDKVFASVQADHGRDSIMDNQKKRMDFMTKNGVDAKKVEETLTSMGVAAKMSRAKKMTETYKIQSTPTFMINDTYQVAPGLIATNDYQSTSQVLNNMLTTLDPKNKSCSKK